ncbi:MAG: hypothetical protein M5U32_00120 [Myxococcota bacterium]|nr:hypothetical protein [Myxococcota bacterium]
MPTAGWPAIGRLATRREDAHADVTVAALRGQHERRFGQVQLEREALHRLRREPPRVGEHREGIAAEALAREDIDQAVREARVHRLAA